MSSAKIKKIVKSTYDKESAIYDETRAFYESGYGGMRERKMINKYIEGPRILNLACGTGRLLPFLLRLGTEIIGIDISRSMIDIARKKVGRRVQFIVCDAEALPFQDETFNSITCSRAFIFFPQQVKSGQEICRCLVGEGKATVSFQTADPVWVRLFNSIFHWKHRSKTVVDSLSKAGLQILHIINLQSLPGILYTHSPLYMLNLLEKVDDHRKTSRFVLIVVKKK